jgi:hypothetical protein
MSHLSTLLSLFTRTRSLRDPNFQTPSLHVNTFLELFSRDTKTLYDMSTPVHTYERENIYCAMRVNINLPTGAINWLPGGDSVSGFSGSLYRSQ